MSESFVEERTIMKKMSGIRRDLRKMKLKKTGYNEYSKFYYYELSDILVPIIEECEKQMLYTHITYPEGKGVLTITDLESQEQQQWEVPHGTAKLTACHDIQNVGAVLTYQRRYLYMTAFEILEPDTLDATSGKPEKKEPAKVATKTAPKEELPWQDEDFGGTVVEEPKPEAKPATISEPQAGRLFAIAKTAGWSNDELKAYLGTYGYTSSREISKKDYKKICDSIEGKESTPRA